MSLFYIETTGSRKIVTTNEDYKISLYFPVLDVMISELHSIDLKIFKSLGHCI